GWPKIVANTLKNSAERSSAKMADVHAEKTSSIREELQDLRSSLPATDQMKFGFDNAKLHKGKMLFSAKNSNFSYEKDTFLWKENLNFEIVSGERLAIKGANGSGKTTLINVILGNLLPQ